MYLKEHMMKRFKNWRKRSQKNRKLNKGMWMKMINFNKIKEKINNSLIKEMMIREKFEN